MLEFEQWLEYTDFELDPDRRADLVAAVSAVHQMLDDVSPGHSTTSWSVDDVDAAIAYAVRTADDGPDAPPAPALMIGVHTFVSYLVETGQWTGRAAVADEVLAACAEWVLGEMVPDVTIPDVDEDIELAALSATRAVDRFDALLDWVGTERPTTKSRWIKPALIPELLRVLELEDTIAPITSMGDHHRLATVWRLAEALELITVTTTRVRPGNTAEPWRTEGLVYVRRAALSAMVRVALLDARVDAPDADEIVGRIVYQGLTPMPMSEDTVDELLEDDEIADLLEMFVRGRLGEILEDGWLVVDADGNYVVPEALRPAVWGGFPDELNPERQRDATMIVVRAELTGVTPPVWRRVRLFSLLTLPDLHEVLQIAFGWHDTYQHHFLEPDGDMLRRYLPASAIDWTSGADPEDGVPLDSVLTKPDDVLGYGYDLEDGWKMVIVVEEIDPSIDDRPVSIVDGSGTSPMEDIGGVPGWMEFLDAVNDPSHARHEELREWAALPSGTRFDPTVFDAVAVNRLLG